MDNPAYDDSAYDTENAYDTDCLSDSEKPKNNNGYKDSSMKNTSSEPGWTNGDPGYRPPDYSRATPNPISKESEVEIKETNTRNPDKSVDKMKLSTQINNARKRTKSTLQSNSVTQPFCPPSGEVATTLTLVLTIVAIFATARTVMGPIADVGGTIFALLCLIVCALIGGKSIIGLCWILRRYCKIDLKLPPLLGMLIVGILLKNIPYNFGQFGRAECNALHRNATGTFVDSINDLDTSEDHGSWKKRSIPDSVQELFDDEHVAHARVVRSLEVDHGDDTNHDDPLADCHPKYIGHDMDPQISRTLRLICLTVILLMAGLELDPVALMKLSSMVMRATFIPCFTEAIAVAALSHFILGFPWTVGLMLGFVLAAVSPAVIIPCLMSLSQRGFGVAKGIPTLVIAACSADDVVAISGFGIFLGITFNTGAPMWKLILHGPIEVLIGISFGVFWGILAQWIPNKEHRHVCFFRWLILLGGGLIALFGAHLIHYDGAGGLAAIIMAFVAGMRWRQEGWGDHNPVTKTFQRMWIILEPVIFALIGTEIQVDKINPSTLGLSVVVLVIALVIRMVGTYFAVCGGDLTVKEKIFMAFAWMPKATVQAALGPIFLDNVFKVPKHLWDTTENKAAWIASGHNITEWNPIGEEDKWLEMGNDILTLAVLSILITAPLGAVCILGLGPKLLETDKKEDDSSMESA